MRFNRRSVMKLLASIPVLGVWSISAAKADSGPILLFFTDIERYASDPHYHCEMDQKVLAAKCEMGLHPSDDRVGLLFGHAWQNININ